MVFTSGGTEANMLALTPSGRPDIQDKFRFDRLLVSAIEHPSVRSGGSFPASQVEEFGATADGTIDLAALERRLNELKWHGKRAAAGLVYGGQ